MRRRWLNFNPEDPDFPDDCDDEDSDQEPCPDPCRDQDTVTKVLAAIDGEVLDDGNSSNDLTPFEIVVAAGKVKIGGVQYPYTLISEGITFVKGGVTRKMEWGTHTDGTAFHPWRISFDGHSLVTVA